MKYTSQHKQLVLDPSWMTLNGLPKNNRWVKPGNSLPRDKIEQIYIVNTATECLKAIFLDGFHYKRAGVVVMTVDAEKGMLASVLVSTIVRQT